MNQYELHEEIKVILKDYVPIEVADGLASDIFEEVKKYTKSLFGFGIALGAIITVLILKWLS